MLVHNEHLLFNMHAMNVKIIVYMFLPTCENGSKRYRVIRNDCRGFNNLPPRSPHATPCDLFLWGYVKDQVYIPPLPACVPELKVQIIETITADMMQTVWNELDYRVHVCRITKGAHIEHL